MEHTAREPQVGRECGVHEQYAVAQCDAGGVHAGLGECEHVGLVADRGRAAAFELGLGFVEQLLFVLAVAVLVDAFSRVDRGGGDFCDVHVAHVDLFGMPIKVQHTHGRWSAYAV